MGDKKAVTSYYYWDFPLRNETHRSGCPLALPGGCLAGVRKDLNS